MVPLTALNGAPSITAKKHLPEFPSSIRKGKDINWADIERELGLDHEDDGDTEEV